MTCSVICKVAARKRDVNVEIAAGHGKPTALAAGSQGDSVHEGEERSFDKSQLCGAPEQPRNTGTNPKWIEIGTGVGSGILTLILLPGGGEKALR